MMQVFWDKGKTLLYKLWLLSSGTVGEDLHMKFSSGRRASCEELGASFVYWLDGSCYDSGFRELQPAHTACYLPGWLHSLPPRAI